VPHELAQILQHVGVYYNNALVVTEIWEPRRAVLSTHNRRLLYRKLILWKSNKSANQKPGVKVNQTNRTLFLESLQNRLLESDG
jgi:hypothetical protein